MSAKPSIAAHQGEAAAQPGDARPLRFISAASLFDGHDAAINMIRRLLQSHGAEVVHLGHNRSVADIVRAAIQEDADGIAVSSYQGGHNEYFAYMVDMLRELNASHIRVIVGGGGTISPDEQAALERYGVEKIYTPEDGRKLGLHGMIDDVFARVRAARRAEYEFGPLNPRDHAQIARSITALESEGRGAELLRQALAKNHGKRSVPVIGITGTGGAGKSSLTDELLQRFVRAFPDRQIALVAIDPTRRRSGGALLGDRIRMNALAASNIFMRSLATRRENLATAEVLREVIDLYAYVGFDLVLVETAGIGQSDTEIVDLVDVPLYVMTSEYGAASQLEKIDMLDFAELIVLNKFEKRGAEDALRDVRKQWRRNHAQRSATLKDADVPVYPTIASRFNDPGVNRLFGALLQSLELKSVGRHGWLRHDDKPVEIGSVEFKSRDPLIPAPRSRYLSEIAEGGRRAREQLAEAVVAARQAYAYYESLKSLRDAPLPAPLEAYADAQLADVGADATRVALRRGYNEALTHMGPQAVGLLKSWPARSQEATAPQYQFKVRDKILTGENYTETLSHLQVPKLAVPRLQDWGELLHFLGSENLPGSYPYTAGVYPYRREAEDPIRMFAGEGGPERTNRRFHYLARGQAATRLSTAFDSTTLYGEDPDTRPDVYGRTGNSGVSIASLDDMKKLYSGFDLCSPTTSVSMTINGPAPMLLAMFMNTAIDQQVERFLKKEGRWDRAQAAIERLQTDQRARGLTPPSYKGELPQGHDGSGLALLGVTGEDLAASGVLTAAEYQSIRARALSQVRGTVQADILKEDQAQNTCIFSTEFAMRMMGDIQQYFIQHGVRNFYSVSISGYHIAEAGANPISQLAFTLSNGFTIVEYYLARGMKIDEFAPNLSFFFSNGMDAEYAVIGRVARRIWARAMRDRYRGDARSQMLKYHIQTSGRSLHAQEIQFNDIRTTLQALYALFDNCNSLHTNAYDEALTTPTEESVRRAVAIQLIINRELGLNTNQNPWSGSFALEYLTDLVEEAVYKEFDSLSERGGVLGAMETMYQRGKIQEESLYYETRKHDGSLPLIGVNTYLPDSSNEQEHARTELIRSTEQEKQDQVQAVKGFQARHAERTPAALNTLQQAASNGGNVFEQLLEAVKVSSLGQISHALYEVGGQFRRGV
ncbi:MAG TPA: methylmalonyl-CoA mutase family protein [Steroidobacteraceae bacterium]|jgi:methylmalonyl-CoA mutase|nr:methylmalonyl-CoA mutase family protein [Steroidobacteraceae bacterium]